MRIRTLLLPLFWASLPAWGQETDLTQIANAGLPVVTIETVDGETPTFKRAVKEDKAYLGNTITDAKKVPGRVSVSLNGEVVFDSKDYNKDTSGMTIRVRGNTSTVDTEKLPYKIKLEKKGDMLFRGNDSIFKDKNWLLVRERNISNRIGYKVNELMGMQWTPAFKYVNVVMNGEYRGLYMLIESVKRNAKCRLNVSKTGYIAEFDPYWWNEDLYVKSELSWLSWLPMHYTFKYPDSDEMTEDQLDYFTETIRRAEVSLTDSTYDKYIDVESFARWMLARDILGNNDGAGSNIYFTKYDNTGDSKLMMANLWDLEGSMRTKSEWDEVHRLGVFFFHDLFDSENEAFKVAYKSIWEEESDRIFEQIQAFISDFSQSEEGAALSKSIALDNQRWDNDVDDVEQLAADARQWFTNRKKWLDNAIQGLETGIRHTKGATTESTAYYDLKGVQVTNPGKGVFIKKANGQKPRLVIFR